MFWVRVDIEIVRATHIQTIKNAMGRKGERMCRLRMSVVGGGGGSGSDDVVFVSVTLETRTTMRFPHRSRTIKEGNVKRNI